MVSIIGSSESEWKLLIHISKSLSNSKIVSILWDKMMGGFELPESKIRIHNSEIKFDREW